MAAYSAPIEFLVENKAPDWLEVSIVAPAQFFPLPDNFFRLHAQGVEFRHPDKQLTSNDTKSCIARLPYNYNTELDNILRKLDACLATIEDNYSASGSICLETRSIHRGRESFTSFQVSPPLVIVPAGEGTSAPQDAVIRINPGRAFGTGRHPSTLMCLQILEEMCTKGFWGDRPAVLDGYRYGYTFYRRSQTWK